ncbi:hypothetical protein [Dialister succinatiphilus]|uniref:hypothetical protein n=1 Tax=Dialister succinatiphilus TaxID=487173 RepID=UPI003F80A980
MKESYEMTVKKANQRYRVLARLELVLHAATDDGITLIDEGNVIIIDHRNGTAQMACVRDDSPLEMAIDILKAVHHGKLFDYPSKEDDPDED